MRSSLKKFGRRLKNGLDEGLTDEGLGRRKSKTAHRRRRSGLDAADRRIGSEVAVLRLAANGFKLNLPRGPSAFLSAAMPEEGRSFGLCRSSICLHDWGRLLSQKGHKIAVRKRPWQ